jgi:hypothetical protein
MTTSAYFTLLSKKRTWTPVRVEAGALTEGTLPTIRRALALRHLELPVKEMLQQGLDRELPATPGIIDLLKSNQNDEEKHDLALGYVAAAHGTDPKAEKVAMQIRQLILEHPDHPITKTAILERSIFFVILPMFRQFGDMGLRTTSADISNDERVHAASHTMISQELKQLPSPSFNKLRKEIIAWLVALLPGGEDPMLGGKFWTSASDNLYSRGVAPELKATRSTRMPAFFETSNVNLPSYG